MFRYHFIYTRRAHARFSDSHILVFPRIAQTSVVSTPTEVWYVIHVFSLIPVYLLRTYRPLPLGTYNVELFPPQLKSDRFR